MAVEPVVVDASDEAEVKRMVDHGGGRVVMTAPVLGLTADTATSGVVQLTRQLTGELAGNGVRGNAIASGLIETPMTEDGALSDSIVPVGRIGQPADLKRTAVYLASEAAGYTTGEAALVDGGMNAV